MTSNTIDDEGPSYSPDGDEITFSSIIAGNYEIYRMNVDGSSPLRITIQSSVDIQPTYSPEGDKIAYTSTQVGDYEIYRMNPLGAGLSPLSVNGALD
ncbi:TolB family protein, partial [Nocardioides humilatus]|uniref:TolB family protein n=1 Tax=Nocardioides humilatus TaxID=2607660 RepID=UPI001CB6E1ED